MAKKINVEDIDEEFIISSFKQESPDTTEEQVKQIADSLVKKDNYKPKDKIHNYQVLFLKEAAIPARLGKTVYLRKEYHERIQRIVRVIAGDEVSIFSYVDNVLAQHFAAYKAEITQLYDQKNESIF